MACNTKQYPNWPQFLEVYFQYRRLITTQFGPNVFNQCLCGVSNMFHLMKALSASHISNNQLSPASKHRSTLARANLRLGASCDHAGHARHQAGFHNSQSACSTASPFQALWLTIALEWLQHIGALCGQFKADLAKIQPDYPPFCPYTQVLKPKDYDVGCLQPAAIFLWSIIWFLLQLILPYAKKYIANLFFLQLNRFQTPVHTPLECQLVGPCGGPLFQLYVLFDFLFKKRQFFSATILGTLQKLFSEFFSMKGGEGYPQLPLRFFGQNDFPLRGWWYPPIPLSKSSAKKQVFLDQKR